MTSSLPRPAPVLAALLAAVVALVPAAGVAADGYAAVRPLLAKYCFDCHTGDEGEAGFGLDRLSADATAARVERRERAERRDRDDRPSRAGGPDPRDPSGNRDSGDRRDMDEGPRSSGPVPYPAQAGE
jgi:hypothetical protein